MKSAYRLVTTPTFERDFKKLGAEVGRRVKKKIEWLALHPEAASQPLRNMPTDLAGLRKYRIGDYRVVLWVDDSNRVIKLYHRSSVYRDI